MGRRLDNHDPAPMVYKVGGKFRQAQRRWVGFLRKMEPRFPGITGTARRLFATLYFGLLEISRAEDLKPLKLSIARAVSHRLPASPKGTLSFSAARRARKRFVASVNDAPAALSLSEHCRASSARAGPIATARCPCSRYSSRNFFAVASAFSFVL